MQNLHLLLILVVLFNPCSYLQLVKSKSKSSQTVLPQLQYHMGPVLTQPINLYIIWYGKQWTSTQKTIIRDFINSLSYNPNPKSKPNPSKPHPLVSQWWATVALYNDQTDANVTKTIRLMKESMDTRVTNLTRLSIQHVINNAVVTKSLPLDYTNGLYLVLTSKEVIVQDFCRGSVCGFHYFTFPSVAGATLPYAWVGNSKSQCPGLCAYPFAWDPNSGQTTAPSELIYKPPNGDVGIDGMINVIAHELAEVASDPLVNAWYAGRDPTAPIEICDLCIGTFGTGGGHGGGYLGYVYNDTRGHGYNLFGVNGARFLVQWVWNPVLKRCYGPNA